MPLPKQFIFSQWWEILLSRTKKVMKWQRSILWPLGFCVLWNQAYLLYSTFNSKIILFRFRARSKRRFTKGNAIGRESKKAESGKARHRSSLEFWRRSIGKTVIGEDSRNTDVSASAIYSRVCGARCDRYWRVWCSRDIMKDIVQVVECFHRLVLNKRALRLFNFDKRLWNLFIHVEVHWCSVYGCSEVQCLLLRVGSSSTHIC